MSIADNIRNISEKLPPAVRLVAVSKFHPLENILEAFAAGQRIFAESRPQEFFAKINSLGELQECHSTGAGVKASEVGSGLPYEDIEWHFIGHLQTNKLKLVLPYVTMVQSVDSERLLSAINVWGRENGKVTNVLLECHISAEESKQGFSDAEVMDLLSHLTDYPFTRVCGLMGMATFTDDEAIVRSDFAKIKGLFDRIRSGLEDSAHSGISGQASVFSPEVREVLSGFRELSIGMSDDYLIALDYGATMVRIGTDIFGPRVY